MQKIFSLITNNFFILALNKITVKKKRPKKNKIIKKLPKDVIGTSKTTDCMEHIIDIKKYYSK